ncbi:hypothetical protein [Acidimangrovimonas sediminis]|uniref:hypothetical protein n=1 Tax=Acidimangrovimonas sediminis TaxID=2056283 RepID=UPI000C80DC5B|nr:hypothetical protein [Acidimangrovimonas sediminis]
MTGPLAIAEEAWGEALPEWVAALAAECAAASQNKVAGRLGVSASMISQVLRRKYPADLTPLEDRFMGVFRHARVDCPALGLMPLNECRSWREKSRTFAAGNPLRLRMYRACAGCPRNRITEVTDD